MPEISPSIAPEGEDFLNPDKDRCLDFEQNAKRLKILVLTGRLLSHFANELILSIRFAFHENSGFVRKGQSQIFAVNNMLLPVGFQTLIDDSEIVAELQQPESCSFFVPWQTKDRRLLLSTTSLIVRAERTYQLDLEIARGTVGRVLQQIADWSAENPSDNGSWFSESLANLASTAQETFASAVFAESPEVQCELANQSIDLAVDLMEQVCREENGKFASDRIYPPRIIGILENEDPDHSVEAMEETLRIEPNQCKFFSTDAFLETNSAEAVAEIYRGLESEKESGQPAMIGPLVDWNDSSSQQIIGDRVGENDFEKSRRVCFDAAVNLSRNLNDLQLVHVAAGIPKSIGLFDGRETLQLTLDCVCGFRESKKGHPLMVSFSSPFAGNMLQDPLGIAPLHAVDALLRSEVGLDFLGLEFDFREIDTKPPRDWLQFCQLIEIWRQFGCKLVFLFKLPHRITDVQAKYLALLIETLWSNRITHGIFFKFETITKLVSGANEDCQICISALINSLKTGSNSSLTES